MSRYRIPHDRFDIWTGWDRELQTFFAQVCPVAQSEDPDDGPLLWVGLTHDEIRSLEIPDDVAFSLNVDFAAQDLIRRIDQTQHGTP